MPTSEGRKETAKFTTRKFTSADDERSSKKGGQPLVGKPDDMADAITNRAPSSSTPSGTAARLSAELHMLARALPTVRAQAWRA